MIESDLTHELERQRARLLLVLRRAALMNSPDRADFSDGGEEAGQTDWELDCTADATAVSSAATTAVVRELRVALAEKEKSLASQQELIALLQQQVRLRQRHWLMIL